LAKEAVARQYFMDFIENLGESFEDDVQLDDEEANLTLTDLFFSGELELKLSPHEHTLLLILDQKR
jgi:hypothetical protein